MMLKQNRHIVLSLESILPLQLTLQVITGNIQYYHTILMLIAVNRLSVDVTHIRELFSVHGCT